MSSLLFFFPRLPLRVFLRGIAPSIPPRFCFLWPLSIFPSYSRPCGVSSELFLVLCFFFFASPPFSLFLLFLILGRVFGALSVPHLPYLTAHLPFPQSPYFHTQALTLYARSTATRRASSSTAGSTPLTGARSPPSRTPLRAGASSASMRRCNFLRPPRSSRTSAPTLRLARVSPRTAACGRAG